MGGLFGSGPKAPAPVPDAPKVDQSVLDRQTQDTMRKRQGSAANILTGNTGGSVSGSVAAKQLLGS